MTDFTFISAEHLLVPLRVTPLMMEHSLFLRAALEAGETEGVVPVARAAVLRLVCAHLQFKDLTERLRRELNPQAVPVGPSYDVTPLHCERARPVRPPGPSSLPTREDERGDDAQTPGEASPRRPWWPLEDEETTSTASSEFADAPVEAPRATRSPESEATAGFFAEVIEHRRGRCAPSPLSGWTSYGVESALEDLADGYFVEHIVFQRGCRRSTGVEPDPASVTDVSVSSPPSSWAPLVLTVAQQALLLELLTAADYLGYNELVKVCATYFTSWLMQTSESDLLETFRPLGHSRGETVCALSPTAEVEGDQARGCGEAPRGEPWKTETSPMSSGRGHVHLRAEALPQDPEHRLVLLEWIKREGLMSAKLL